MLTADLIAVAEVFCAAKGMSRARLATLIFNHGAKFDLIEQGADIGVRTFERAMAWLSANWPEGAEWPAQVARPDPVQPIDEVAQ